MNKILAILIMLTAGLGLIACSDSAENIENADSAAEESTKVASNSTEESQKMEEEAAPEKDEPMVYPDVFIASPEDGAKVTSPVLVKFGAKNVEIVPAGTDLTNSGHHHLLVNAELPDLNKPMGDEVLHFGKGQMETELELPPGTHTLQLVLGDAMHKPHDRAIYSEKITIEVVE